MKIEKNLNWNNPTIYLEDDNFFIDINKDDIEIECNWDYGYGGSGTERIFIKTKFFFDLLKQITSGRKLKEK